MSSRPFRLFTAALLGTLTLPAAPLSARQLNCAAVRAALNAGKAPADVAMQFHTSTRRVFECKTGKDQHHHRTPGSAHGPHGRSLVRPTHTPIPERDQATPLVPTPESPRRGARG
ncbi:MAG: hypothetical protein HYR72_06615 [Deltaproteobacteria bacterium]|nr:hypothetical protein [Deltaproteobacteria bacterium]MBI3387119.1 hypothetical protein [Deltaproteobacteria bacterium]